MRLPTSGVGLWGLRGLIALIATAASVLLVEFALRMTPESSWHGQVEDQAAHGRVPSVYIGERRFKLRAELPRMIDPKSNVYRILFLGDSFTYGSGVENVEDVFPALVTKQLQEWEADVSGQQFAYFNGGIPGSLTGRWLQLQRKVDESFDPDLVVTVFFLRDGTRGMGERGKLRKSRQTIETLRRESFLFSKSRLVRELVKKRMESEFSGDYLDRVKNAYRGEGRSTDEWKRAQANLLLLRDRAEAQGSDFVLVIFPILFGLQGEYPLALVMAEIEKFTAAHGIPSLSLLPAFQGEKAEELWVSSADQHPNRRAHSIAAEAIAEFLFRRNQTQRAAPLPKERGASRFNQIGDDR